MNYTTLTGSGWPRAAGALVFALPCLSLLTPWGISACSFLFLLAALACPRRSAATLRAHWPAVRLVVLAFLLHFLFAALCLALRPDARLATLERPARMLFAASALALVLANRPPASVLWHGAAAGALGGFGLVAWQAWSLGIDRPGGFGNAITFADVAVCLALLALAGALWTRSRAHQAWLALGGLAGIGAALLTGSRGGLVGLLLAALPLALVGLRGRRPRVRLLAALSALALALVLALPQLGLRERLHEAVRESAVWADGGSAFSNVGTRLELWKGAALLLAEHPWLGMDRAHAELELAQRVAEGELDPAVLPMPHFHNDAVQALVAGGVPGLLAWLAILLAPLRFFWRALTGATAPAPATVPPAPTSLATAPAPSQRRAARAAALAGVLVVVSYLGFGMTEAIFWSVGGSLLYAQLVFVLMALCLNPKEEHGK